MSSDLVIRVDNVSKHYQVYDKPLDRLKQSLYRGRKQFYKDFRALDDINLEIKKGETVGIIGRNGSGKSTLLQMICGTLTPTAGSISVEGRVAALLELGAGFNPEFTGRENVYMNGAILGLSSREIDEKFESIADFADIGEYIDQPVKTYSSGMYVRLAFAVIAHADADILVVDEALSVGDAFFVQKCMRFLRGFMAHGTILFVSHDTAAVNNLCDRAVLLENGTVSMIGTPKDVTEKYLEESFMKGGETYSADVVAPESEDSIDEDFRDIRLDYLNQSSLRNDIEVFRFDPDTESFGVGGARIDSVVLIDSSGRPLSWIVGGELVTLKIRCSALVKMDAPIVGFYLKDRLGQSLFGDNTYIEGQRQAKTIGEGQVFIASFQFRMPFLPVGDYSVAVAVANGTQSDHVQHHWIHDALIISSHTTSVSQGLVGLPMKNIKLDVAN